MATAKRRNPVKTMLVVLIILVMACIAIQIFWTQKMNLSTGKVGRIGVDNGGSAPAPVSSSVPTNTISQADDPLTGPVE